jgi:hypothetical protein
MFPLQANIHATTQNHTKPLDPRRHTTPTVKITVSPAQPPPKPSGKQKKLDLQQ